LIGAILNKQLVKGLSVVAVTYVLVLAASNASAQSFSFQSVIQWLTSMQSQTSAWAVATKQTAVSADVLSSSLATNAQQLSTAMGAMSMSDRVTKAVMSVDGTYGQPVTLKCVAQRDSAMQVEAWQQVSNDRSKLMSTFASTRVIDKSYADRERMALHKDSYCTVSEAKSGMCQLKANGMQGWDSNYGGAFGENTLPAEGELAGYAYVAMVADTRAPASLDCKSEACNAAAAEQLEVAAQSTMVADSLVGQVLERRVPVLTGK